MFLGLTTDNQEEFRVGISLSCLPSAIQDAVNITSAVGIKNLWVDQCCILQDDASDKTREISKMADVFSRSRLTICLDTNLRKTIIRNDHGLPRHFEPMSMQVEPYQIYGKVGLEKSNMFKDMYINMLESAVYWSRAWKFQEGILNVGVAKRSKKPLSAQEESYTGQRVILSADAFDALYNIRSRNQATDHHDQTPSVVEKSTFKPVDSIRSEDLQNMESTLF